MMSMSRDDWKCVIGFRASYNTSNKKNLGYKQKSQNFDLSDLLKPLWTMHIHVTNLAFFRQINTQFGVFIYNRDFLFLEVL